MGATVEAVLCVIDRSAGDHTRLDSIGLETISRPGRRPGLTATQRSGYAEVPIGGDGMMGFVRSHGFSWRRAVDEDLPFLQTMLYEAANRPGSPWPAFDVSMEEARNKRFWSGWMREGDIGVVAEEGTIPVGAAWIRRFSGEELSPIDDEGVPVLAIGVERDHRGRGVGGLLMDALIEQARASGVRAVSLTAGLFNDAAVHLYRRRGFVEVLRRGEGVKMVLVLD